MVVPGTCIKHEPRKLLFLFHYQYRDYCTKAGFHMYNMDLQLSNDINSIDPTVL
jgi:hypothetical protein